MKRFHKFLHRTFTGCLLLLAVSSLLVSAQTVDLANNWQFLPDPEAKYSLADLAGTDQKNWRPILVDRSWNAQFEDLRDYMGVAWYRVQFEVPQFSSPKRTLIRFGAVDYACEVFVNGKSAGAHEGGYTPFALDVTDSVRPGINQLFVRVVDPVMGDKSDKTGMPYDEIPHGKQHWYVQTGGIWQPVQLEFRPNPCIEDIDVTPHLNGDVQISVELGGVQSGSLVFTVRDSAGAAVARGTTQAQSGKAVASAHVQSPQLWSPASPSLYTLEVELSGSQDTRRERFGFRKFEARDGKLFLNGEPFYMIAALDQDFYPETIYTPPSKAYVLDQMLKGKRMGLNLLRCHIKVCDPNYLDAADEAGMLVWYEIPSWNDANMFTPKAAERGEQIFAEMVDRDWNHPSIVLQSIMNESWGARLANASERKWLLEAFDRAKEMTAPLGRLIVDNSACCNNFHVKSDLDDFHQYFSIPDNHAKWDKWTADFASRPKWSFSPHGDAVRTGKEPLIVSEFGNWGLPKLPENLPWWFGRDFGGRQVTRPAGLFDRFRDYKFTRLYPTFNDLAEATQWHQFDSLKHEIEEMRRYGSIQGYVITEFTDINWEVNGLMDMWRNPKVYATRLAHIQAPDVVMARLAKRNFRSGESVTLSILASRYGAADWRGAQLRWHTQSGPSGYFNVSQPPVRGTVADLQTFTFVAPGTNAPRKEWIALQLVAADGSVLAQNRYEIFVYPQLRPVASASIAIHDPVQKLSELSRTLQKSGYRITATAGKGLLISSVLDDVVSKHLNDGGRALLLLDSANALPKSSVVAIKAREGSDLDGNWVTNFNWVLADSAPFRSAALAKILGFEAAAVTPHFVLRNIPAAAYDDVLAGIFYGWLNDNSGLAIQARHGKGALLATTFRFSEYAADPYSRNLLDGMIAYVAGAEFKPTFDWNAGTNSAGK
ncbi:MAG TPA: hypothetical protein VD837_01240 [Terriglobales bacterium]|nr:hypothetical protein [Terriglobales bacterium]